MADQYIYDMSDTWNSGGTTFNAIKMNVTDSASAAASTLIDLQISGTSKFKVDKTGKVTSVGALVPSANDGAALGVSGTAWADLFLATGAVINFGAGDLLITGSANALTFEGSTSGYLFDAALRPTTNDAAALGVSGAAWSDIFLAVGAVVNLGAGDVLITHSSNALAFSGATGGYSFDGLVKFSSTANLITTATSDGSDNASIEINGGGATGNTRGGAVLVYGNESATAPGRVELLPGTGASGVVYVNGEAWFVNAASPSVSDGAALGSGTRPWSDLFLASGGVINFNSGDVTFTHSANTMAFAGASSGYTFDAVVKASANDGAALGASGTAWSDLFLASGAVINFDAGDVTLTHSANGLAFAGASNGYTFDAAIKPSANDGAALGVSGTAWSDVFLATGAVLNFGAGNYTVTHSSGLVNFSGTIDQGGGHATNGSSVGVSLLAGSIRSSQTSTGSATHAIYYNPNGQVGSITTNASATAYNTSSDERLKHDFRPLDDAGEIIDNLAIHVFDWKGGGTGCGVVAQEAYGVFPDAVTPGSGEPGEKDFVPWGVDYSKFVPVIIAEVQSLRNRVAVLEGSM